jgi:hypothetical protein
MTVNALCLVLGALCGQSDPPRFTDVQIEKPFDTYLQAQPVLMELAGAKVIRLPDGNKLVIGVASTPIRNDSAEDRARAELVCKTRALVHILGEEQGVVIAHSEEIDKKVTVVVDRDGKRKTRTTSQYLDVTRAKLEGTVKDFPVVGSWKSGDGKVYYLAIGGILNARGERVPPKDVK